MSDIKWEWRAIPKRHEGTADGGHRFEITKAPGNRWAWTYSGPGGVVGPHEVGTVADAKDACNDLLTDPNLIRHLWTPPPELAAKVEAQL